MKNYTHENGSELCTGSISQQRVHWLVWDQWDSTCRNLAYSKANAESMIGLCWLYRLTAVPSKSIGDMSNPSRVTLGSSAPANFINVGKMSTVAASYESISHMQVINLGGSNDE